jgi:hypothetical protein
MRLELVRCVATYLIESVDSLGEGLWGSIEIVSVVLLVET